MLPVFSDTLGLGFFAALVMCLVLGVFFPFYDLARARKSAHKRGKPIPGKDFLIREFKENSFLGSFFFIVGIILMLTSILVFLKDRSWVANTTWVVVLVAVGIGFTHMGQIMLRPPPRRWKRL